jgi:hypothetical protein
MLPFSVRIEGPRVSTRTVSHLEWQARQQLSSCWLQSGLHVTAGMRRCGAQAPQMHCTPAANGRLPCSASCARRARHQGRGGRPAAGCNGTCCRVGSRTLVVRALKPDAAAAEPQPV